VRKRAGGEQQGNLFGEVDRRSRERRPQKKSAKPVATTDKASGKQGWRMPESGGSTVASIRLLWTKRLTPAQIGQVEAEIAALPRMLTNLGFGAVLLERSSVRRKKS
jgi:hypothetical protein